MAFQNDTNKGRVQKIMEILDLIEKSANSNRASVEERLALLEPVLDKLALGPDPAAPVYVDAPQATAVRVTLSDLVDRAPVNMLPSFVALAMTRIEDELVPRSGGYVPGTHVDKIPLND